MQGQSWCIPLVYLFQAWADPECRTPRKSQLKAMLPRNACVRVYARGGLNRALRVIHLEMRILKEVDTICFCVGVASMHEYILVLSQTMQVKFVDPYAKRHIHLYHLVPMSLKNDRLSFCCTVV